jgi:hypothetical protein
MLAGCGKSKPIDPANDRLSEGTEVRLYHAKNPTVFVLATGNPEPDGISVDVGTRARILADPSPATPPRVTEAYRLVKVLILDGKHEGVAGDLLRMDVRPRVNQ